MTLSIVIITNGMGDNLKNILPYWKSDFDLGIDLFLCGPVNELNKYSNRSGIINYDEIINKEKNEIKLFSINSKKYYAATKISSEYIFFIHDRFIPAKNFKNILNNKLNKDKPDFGSCNLVNNSKETSLPELRLKKNILNSTLSEALFKEGRLVCSKIDEKASSHVGLNGGAFFLKKNNIDVLRRPMKWSEMEDDIMSYDLMHLKGLWIEDTYLTTIIQKGNYDYSKNKYILNFKLFAYKILCQIIKLHLKIVTYKYYICTINDKLYDKKLIELNKNLILIDPLHRMYDTDLFNSSLEKLMTRFRILSENKLPYKILKIKYGWKIYIKEDI